jgi:hypothetical protein
LDYALAERLALTVLFAINQVTLSHPTPQEILAILSSSDGLARSE